MKQVVWIIVCTLLLSACKNQEENNYIPGKIVTQVNYKGANTKSALKHISLKATNADRYYTGFGDYITSLTPSVFKAKFHCIRYVDELNAFNQIELLNNNLPGTDPLRYADFTNNSSVTMQPSLGGDLGNNGASFTNRVHFKYFYFRIQFFYQEVQLPQQYSGIRTLNQFSAADSANENENNQVFSSLSKNILKARYRMFLFPLYEYIQRLPDAFVFGGTDSSYVLNLFTHPHDFPNNLPYDGDYIVRSKNYNPITYIPSEISGKTTLINATLTFDYNHLIQIYAGADNIPYTKDDVFLYAPSFWDRLLVNVIIE